MSNPFVWPPVVAATTGVNPTPTGTGGATVPGFSQWWPDAPPITPNALDDEFTSDVLDPKWTVWQPAGGFTFAPDTNKRMLKMQGTNNGAARTGAIVQAIPGGSTGEFAVIAKLAYVYNCPTAAAQAIRTGLVLTGNVVTTPLTAQARMSGLYGFDTLGTGRGSMVRNYNTYATGGVELVSYNDGSAIMCYFRIRYNNTIVFYESSYDGIGWYRMLNDTIAFAPAYVGLGFSLEGAGAGQLGTAYVDFIRFFTGAGSSGIDSSFIGRYV